MMYEEPRKTVKYCCACWREDLHVSVHVGYGLTLFIKVLTLGLAIPLWPYRCATCGRRRVRSDFLADLLAKIFLV